MKNIILMVTSTIITLLIAIGLLRWLAPGLLGISTPTDLQMVQVDRKVVPFFDNVFRVEDYQSTEFILPDPFIKRAKPLFSDQVTMGPHDLLGFRNRSIPSQVDLLTIGDSQTYGNNAILEDNWPNQLQQALPELFPDYYNMAVGGWGAVEYDEMFQKAIVFKPKLFVIAFYTGNDPLDSFVRAYSLPRWQNLRPNADLTAADAPQVEFPPPASSLWSVNFADGSHTVFSPALRLSSNQDQPAVVAGYGVMANVAAHIADMTKLANQALSKQEHAPMKVVFTIIPTKEWVYADKIRQEKLVAPPDYDRLIARESANIADLSKQISALSHVTYIDVTQALRQALAAGQQALYPSDGNGHPLAAGYKVIAQALAKQVSPLFAQSRVELKPGLLGIHLGDNRYQVYLLRDQQLWHATTPDILRDNGWSLAQVPMLKLDDIAHLPRAGTIDTVDAKFAPRPDDVGK